MKLFVVEFSGVWLGGYGLILAPDAATAEQMVLDGGMAGYNPDECNVIDITDKLQKSGDRYLIWDGDY